MIVAVNPRCAEYRYLKHIGPPGFISCLIYADLTRQISTSVYLEASASVDIYCAKAIMNCHHLFPVLIPLYLQRGFIWKILSMAACITFMCC